MKTKVCVCEGEGEGVTYIHKKVYIHYKKISTNYNSILLNALEVCFYGQESLINNKEVSIKGIDIFHK